MGNSAVFQDCDAAECDHPGGLQPDPHLALAQVVALQLSARPTGTCNYCPHQPRFRNPTNPATSPRMPLRATNPLNAARSGATVGRPSQGATRALSPGNQIAHYLRLGPRGGRERACVTRRTGEAVAAYSRASWCRRYTADRLSLDLWARATSCAMAPQDARQPTRPRLDGKTQPE